MKPGFGLMSVSPTRRGAHDRAFGDLARDLVALPCSRGRVVALVHAGLNGGGDIAVDVLRPVARFEVDGLRSDGVTEHGREVLKAGVRPVEADRKVTDEVGAFADVARPFQTRGQGHERAVRRRPEPLTVERVGRAVEDGGLIVPHPLHTLVERYLVDAEQAREVDRQPAGAVFGDRMTIGEGQQSLGDIIALRAPARAAGRDGRCGGVWAWR